MEEFLWGEDEVKELIITTILSHRTKEGMIDIELGGEKILQFDIPKAKIVRDMLSEAIEAAISDAITWKFLTERVGMSEELTARALVDYRQLRQGTKGVRRFEVD